MTKESAATPAVRKFLTEIGRKGGAVKGPSKRRGDADYYRQLRLKAVQPK